MRANHLLEAYKDILQQIVSQTSATFCATNEDEVSFWTKALQEAASKTLTLGLDLWFGKTFQQLELFHNILIDKKRLLNTNSSNAYSMLLNQFTRHLTISKLVLCGLNTLNYTVVDTQYLENFAPETEKDKNIFLETLQLLLEINEKHTCNQIANTMQINCKNERKLVNVEEESQTTLNLLLAFHLEGLSAASEKISEESYKLLEQATKTFDAISRILIYSIECVQDVQARGEKILNGKYFRY